MKFLVFLYALSVIARIPYWNTKAAVIEWWQSRNHVRGGKRKGLLPWKKST